MILSKKNTDIRINRNRKKIRGDSNRPRLAVFKSNKYLYAQLIDDSKGVTLASVSEKSLITDKKTKMEKASIIGDKICELAKDKKINQVVFDRRGYKYHGRIKALADAARKNGLSF